MRRPEAFRKSWCTRPYKVRKSSPAGMGSVDGTCMAACTCANTRLGALVGGPCHGMGGPGELKPARNAEDRVSETRRRADFRQRRPSCLHHQTRRSSAVHLQLRDPAIPCRQPSDIRRPEDATYCRRVRIVPDEAQVAQRARADNAPIACMQDLRYQGPKQHPLGHAEGAEDRNTRICRGASPRR